LVCFWYPLGTVIFLDGRVIAKALIAHLTECRAGTGRSGGLPIRSQWKCSTPKLSRRVCRPADPAMPLPPAGGDAGRLSAGLWSAHLPPIGHPWHGSRSPGWSSIEECSVDEAIFQY
jgi:hypothetical protein